MLRWVVFSDSRTEEPAPGRRAGRVAVLSVVLVVAAGCSRALTATVVLVDGEEVDWE